MNDLGEVAYILRMKIYKDRSKRLLGLSQSIYIDTVGNSVPKIIVSLLTVVLIFIYVYKL